MFKVCLPCMLSALVCVGVAGSAAQAQDQAAAPVSTYVAPEAYTPMWSDDGIAKIASQLEGSWKSESADNSVLMTVAAVPVAGMDNTLYVESSRASTPWEPYRRAFFQLYRYKGEVRLRTYEMAVGDKSEGVFDGMWAAPELFPQIASDDLIATLDVELEMTSSGFTGATPYPYPTGAGGAVEMTSSVTLDGNTMTVADRGYDAKGNVVWGADAGASFRFERTEAYAQIDRRDDGMVIIDFGGANGIVPHQDDQLHVHYDGFLADATRFDSSYARDMAFIFSYPPGTRAIAGWGIGMENFAMGNHRKFVIPGYLAYGERGNPRANIPPNSTLYFNVFMAQIDHIEATESQDGSVDPHAGHNHD
jgi:FKBP-type peptidyl-prolyl cis-trans isomerase/CpeT/CpcT family (DUF1001)